MNDVILRHALIPIRIGYETLVGSLIDQANYPSTIGNCFEIVGAGHCCNMYVENAYKSMAKIKL